MRFFHRLLLLLRLGWARASRFIESPEVSLRRLEVECALRRAREVDRSIEAVKRWISFARARDWFIDYGGQTRISSLAAPECPDHCPTCCRELPPGWMSWVRAEAERLGGRLVPLEAAAAAEVERAKADLDEQLRDESAAMLAAWRAEHPDYRPPEVPEAPTLAEDIHRVAELERDADCEVEIALAQARLPGCDPRAVERLVNSSEPRRRAFWCHKNDRPLDCALWHAEGLPEG